MKCSSDKWFEKMFNNKRVYDYFAKHLKIINSFPLNAIFIRRVYIKTCIIHFVVDIIHKARRVSCRNYSQERGEKESECGPDDGGFKRKGTVEHLSE